MAPVSLTRLTTLGQGLVVAVAASSYVVTDPYIATLWNPCPSACKSLNANDWDLYSNLRILKSCEEPMLLNMVVGNVVPDTDFQQPVYACVVTGNSSIVASTQSYVSDMHGSAQYTAKHVEVETAWRGEESNQYSSHAETTVQHVQSYLNAPENQNATIVLGYWNGVALGAFLGYNMDRSTDKSILQSFLDKLQKDGMKKTGMMMQVCSADRSAASNLGVVAEAKSDPTEALRIVKTMLATWNNGGCVQGYSGASKSQMVVGEAVVDDLPTSHNSTHLHSRRSFHGRRDHSGLHQRGDCRVVVAKKGEGCPELAARCGISTSDFTKYNPDKSLCPSLGEGGQHVCCSAGTLPDYSPKPNPDGTCAVYTLKANDGCKGIASAHDISEDDIETWNKKTWAWTGCGNLQAGGKICISKGDPPMPSIVNNAVCGPQKNGTIRPEKWDDIEKQNPCPLNACCDVFGQCGTTKEFCTRTKSTTGAPGTAADRTNGCISNCGTDIVFKDGGFDDHPVIVGYYEAFQNTRSCLNLDVTAINNTLTWGGQDGDHSLFKETWDHIHFAFANITEDFEVDVSSVKKEFEDFKKFDSPGKRPRVLSFGGWSFSTNSDSYAIFRKGVTDEQRSLFASNVAKYADDNQLDGLDFDWEYPSAPDIPGIPKGDPGDGGRYLAFLKELRDKLSTGMTLSIAAPSSYWYLKGFPIKDISDVVDYIVYMTYDLHGQWDYSNPHAAEGCDGSACLRSHVNYTEITNSLSMITKAGVPNSKIVAGLASYGRSFGMTDPKCFRPECKFTGPESTAMAGECTNTPGYISNAEIGEWLQNDNVTTFFDDDSRSTISYANGTWVAYNDAKERNDRITEWWYNRTVLGTSLWAMDLTEFVDEYQDGTAVEPFEMIDCNLSFDSLDDMMAADHIEPFCVDIYLMQALHNNITASLESYQDILKTDYDQKFGWYVAALHQSAPTMLKNFLSANSSKYFTCTEVPFENGLPKPGADNMTVTCPDDEYGAGYATYWWTAKDLDGFKKDFPESTGISLDWLIWDISVEKCTGGGGAAGSDPKVCTGSANYGKPSIPRNINNEGDFHVFNPKDVISKRLPNITTFQDSFSLFHTLAVDQMYLGSTSDVVDGVSAMAMMLSNSLTSMRSVEEIGNNAHEEEIKSDVLFFITALLLIIPGIGEIAEEADIAALAATLRFTGDAGAAGLSTYDVVTSKDRGPAVIFEAILGGLGALDMIQAPKLFEKAATARRAIKESEVANMGEEVAGGLDQINLLRQRCH